MSLHRVNPVMPLIEPLPGGMNVGSQLSVNGSTHLNADRFSINLQCGPNVSPRRDDVALHLSLDFTRRVVVRNSIQNMNWGPEESFGDMPLYPGQTFNITITMNPDQFAIQVNQSTFFFPHRLPPQRVTHVTMDGSAILSELRFNSCNSMHSGGYPFAGSASYPPYPGGGAPPYPGSYLGGGAGPYPTSGGYAGNSVQPNQNSGLMSKLGMGVGGSVVGAALASKLGGKKLLKNNKKMAKKALKYGVPIAGAGVGAYALSHALGGHHHKFHFGHHGSSSSSSSSSSDSD